MNALICSAVARFAVSVLCARRQHHSGIKLRSLPSRLSLGRIARSIEVGRENESRKADLQRRHVLDGGYNGGESHAHDADRTWHPAVFAGGSPHFLRTARARPLVVRGGTVQRAADLP